MSGFNYHVAKSLAGASATLGGAEDGAFLAGGMTLLPTIKQGLTSPSDLIDIGRIRGMSKLTAGREAITAGALVTHDAVASSRGVRRSLPALADLAESIGDAQVRNRGTIGGSIANNDPAADYPAACLGLGATITTDRRDIAADDFFTALFETALEAGEIIRSVSFPLPEKAAYMKFANPATRFALVGVFVSKGAGGVRVAVTGAGQSGVFRVAEMEAALANDFSAAAIEGLSVPAEGLNTDIHAGAGYRAHLIGVMAERAVEACA